MPSNHGLVATSICEAYEAFWPKSRGLHVGSFNWSRDTTVSPPQRWHLYRKSVDCFSSASDASRGEPQTMQVIRAGTRSGIQTGRTRVIRSPFSDPGSCDATECPQGQALSSVWF